MKHGYYFSLFARRTSDILGAAWAFLIAFTIIIVWAVTGPLFHYSNTWQLIINTGTTIVTFLMVFLIQNTQNRDAKALHLKLDEIIRSLKRAHNELIDIEDLDDDDLKRIAKLYKELDSVLPGAAPGKTLQHDLKQICHKDQEDGEARR